MTCDYCRTHNDEEDHRCNRCGRRLARMMPVQHGALAPALEPEIPFVDYAPIQMSPPAGPQLVTELPKASERSGCTVQASLFGPQEVTKNVPPPKKQSTTADTPVRARRDRSAQHALDFNARTLPTSVDAAVYCNAPVAIAIHRALAAALDVSIVLIALGVFLGTAHFAGHEIVLTKQTLPVYGAVAVLISLFYRVVFCIANADTLGMHWTGLRLLNFDGRFPTRSERVCRTAGACVSVIAIGIGFAWSLFDEERLTWHDYISKTFPSPRLM